MTFRNIARGILGNFLFVLFCWITPRRVALPRPQIGYVISSIGMALAAVTVQDAVTQWPIDNLEPWGVSATLSWLFVVISALVVGLTVANRSDLIAYALVIAGNGLALGVLLRWGALHTCPDCFNWHHWSAWATYSLLAVLPVVPGLWYLIGSGWRNGLRFVPAFVLLAAAVTVNAAFFPYHPIFTRDYSANTKTAKEAEPARVDVERLYYAQAEMMEQRTHDLRPHVTGQTDIYALSLGGFAHQGVFLREAEAVSNIMQSNYDALGRTITLANSRADPFKHPMANLPNISMALGAIANQMDTEEDIAFLFLTSHGSEGSFALSFYEAGVNTLTPETLATALDKSGLKYIVIMISACHSGTFIDALRGENRLIMTAAAADANSFGCSDTNEWTWWGRAYFHEALSKTLDFREAFEIADALVADWEKAGEQEPSNPQIALGGRMDRKLDQLFSDPTRSSRFSIAHRQTFAARISTALERLAKRNGVQAGSEFSN